MKALIEAVETNNHVSLSQQLKQLKLSNNLSLLNATIDDNESTLLHIACHKKSYDCLSLLLRHGANPNKSAAGGLMPLHIAASGGDRYSTSILLNHSADLNATYCNTNPIYMAYQNDHKDLVKYLLSYKTDLKGIIDLALSKSDFDMLFLILHGMSKGSLSELHKKILLPLRDQIWKALETMVALKENTSLKTTAYSSILDATTPLGSIFNQRSALSFWQEPVYVQKARIELTSSGPRRNLEFKTQEVAPLLNQPIRNYDSFSRPQTIKVG